MKKKLNESAILNELREGSVFFRGQQSPVKEQSNERVKPYSDTVTHSVSDPLSQSHSVTLNHPESYEVPHFRKLKRLHLRLTKPQDKYLTALEDTISDARPEGERSDPNYKRITKNSIIRALVEIARRLDLSVDASSFNNERDLLKALVEELSKRLAELPSD